jgi:ferredoxin-type protein NapH
MGAFYGVLGRKRLLKIDAIERERCDNCRDCYLACPEPQALKEPLKKNSPSSLVASPDCTNCGRWIDVCEPKVFEFTTRSAGAASG